MLKKIFNTDWITIYMESDSKNPIYTSSTEKLEESQIKSYFESTSKALTEEVFIEKEDEKGLFIYEFNRNKDKFIVLFKFNQTSNENIHYNYFKFMQKYELFRVLKHLSNYILKAVYVVNQKSSG